MGFRLGAVATGAAGEDRQQRQGDDERMTPGLEAAVHGEFPVPVAEVLHALKQPLLLIGLLVFGGDPRILAADFRDLKPP